MKRLTLFLLLIMGFLVRLSADEADLPTRKKDKNMDYQFVTDTTRQTDIADTFLNCTFGSPQAQVTATLEQSPDITIAAASSYGSITLNAVFFNDFLFQTAQLLFTRNRFSNILFGSTFPKYEDALSVYRRVKKYLAEEYGPSLFKQKKEEMANVYDMEGKNACMLTLMKKEDAAGNVRFNLILNYWNKYLQPDK